MVKISTCFCYNSLAWSGETSTNGFPSDSGALGFLLKTFVAGLQSRYECLRKVWGYLCVFLRNRLFWGYCQSLLGLLKSPWELPGFFQATFPSYASLPGRKKHKSVTVSQIIDRMWKTHFLSVASLISTWHLIWPFHVKTVNTASKQKNATIIVWQTRFLDVLVIISIVECLVP